MAAYYADSSVLARTASLQPYGRFGDLNEPNQGMSAYDLPTDSEGDVEIDELVSDTEDEQLTSASVAGQKKGGRKLGERMPGTTLLPASRVENMIHSDGASTTWMRLAASSHVDTFMTFKGVTGNLSMSREAVFTISVATEEFIKRMVQAGHRSAAAVRRNTVHYTDMGMLGHFNLGFVAQLFSPASSTQQYQEFMFLQDTIPEPISLLEALARREAKLKEDLAANPAVASSIQGQSTSSAPILSGQHTNGKAKKKSRVPQEKDKSARSSPSAHLGDYNKDVEMEVDGPEVNHVIPPSRSSSGRVIKASRVVREGMQESLSGSIVNGSSHELDPVEPWSGSASPPRAAPGQRPTYDYQQPYPPSWPGQYTGPASGFLQDPSHAWTYVKQNPGRTIYSQQSRAENTTYR
ncbi:hypothetical protein EDC04DRAFT_3137558 [Pisolithus marmoratus]|nr:hypothetical protein EDC04DRAFT_3137558 [Pisolithus marmoratus]